MSMSLNLQTFSHHIAADQAQWKHQIEQGVFYTLSGKVSTRFQKKSEKCWNFNFVPTDGWLIGASCIMPTWRDWLWSQGSQHWKFWSVLICLICSKPGTCLKMKKSWRTSCENKTTWQNTSIHRKKLSILSCYQFSSASFSIVVWLSQYQRSFSIAIRFSVSTFCWSSLKKNSN